METSYIIESLYQGVPYIETENVRVERWVNPSKKCSITRFPDGASFISPNQVFEPYKINFEKYKELLDRVKIEREPCEDETSLVKFYDGNSAIIREPKTLPPLLYISEDSNESYLTPYGIIAFLLRKSYGDDRFRQYVNRNILKGEYYKSGTRTSPPFYFWKQGSYDISYLKGYRELFLDRDWKIVQDFVIQSPYIYSWRD